MLIAPKWSSFRLTASGSTCTRSSMVSAWQVELWSPAAMMTAYSNIGDISGVKLVTDDLSELSKELPRMRSLAQLGRGTHALLTGDLEKAIELLEELRTSGRLSGYPGCTSSLGSLAATYNQAGYYAKAKALCEEVLGRIDDADRDFVVFTLKLELQLALAEAALGDTTRAAERVDDLIEKYGHNRGPVTLAALHQARARIALLSGNVPLFRRHVSAMGEIARATGNPSLIVQWQRLERKVHQAAGQSDAPSVLGHTAAVSTAVDPELQRRASDVAMAIPDAAEGVLTQAVVATPPADEVSVEPGRPASGD